MKAIATLCNSLSLLAAFSASLMVGALGLVFLSSHVSSDKQMGFLMLLLVPLFLGIPSLGLWLSRKKRGKMLWLGFGLGLISLLFYILVSIVLPGAISAAAQP